MLKKWIAVLLTVCGILTLAACTDKKAEEEELTNPVHECSAEELTEKTGADMHKVKWIYDISSLAVAILLMLLFFHRFSFDQIGVGTLLVTVLNTPLIAMFGKLLDRFVSFDSAFPKFHDWFERIMN